MGGAGHRAAVDVDLKGSPILGSGSQAGTRNAHQHRPGIAPATRCRAEASHAREHDRRGMCAPPAARAVTGLATESATSSGPLR